MRPASSSPVVSVSVPACPDRFIVPDSGVLLVTASHCRVGPDVLAEAGTCSHCRLVAPHATFTAALRGVELRDEASNCDSCPCVAAAWVQAGVSQSAAWHRHSVDWRPIENFGGQSRRVHPVNKGAGVSRYRSRAPHDKRGKFAPWPVKLLTLRRWSTFGDDSLQKSGRQFRRPLIRPKYTMDHEVACG